MSKLLIDFGASRIKSVLLQNDIFINNIDYLPPIPCNYNDRKYEIPISEIKDIFYNIVKNNINNNIDSIFICSEQHGFALMNGNNLVYKWYGFGNSLTDLCYYLVPLFCFIGHSYSCFIKFKGGKIVSTVVGLMFATTYLAIPIFIVIFFISLKTSKYVSLSSMIMSSSFMIFTWIVYLIYLFAGYTPQISNYLMYFSISGPISIFYPIIATLGNILLIYKHRENIKRLINKTESKVKWIDNIGKNKNSD